MGGHVLPDLVESVTVDRATGQDRCDPAVWRRRHEVQRGGQFPGRPRSLGLPPAIGLVDGDHVGEFEDAAFDALE